MLPKLLAFLVVLVSNGLHSISGSSMFWGSTAIGKEYFKNVPETKLYFYVACLRDIKMLLHLRSINILLDIGT